MYSMGNQLRARKVRSLHSLVQVGAVHRVIEVMELVLNPVERVRNFHSCQKLATDVGKADTNRYRTAKAVDMVCRGCGKKGHFEKVCLKGTHSTHSFEVPQTSTSTAGAGASEPLYLMMRGSQYTHIWSVSPM